MARNRPWRPELPPEQGKAVSLALQHYLECPEIEHSLETDTLVLRFLQKVTDTELTRQFLLRNNILISTEVDEVDEVDEKTERERLREQFLEDSYYRAHPEEAAKQEMFEREQERNRSIRPPASDEPSTNTQE